MDPHWYTSLTIYVALTGLAVRLLGDVRPKWISFPWRRWSWTVGCVAFVGHVWAAFAGHHHWSHAAAFQVTAERTREMLGVSFGAGIYFSYAFGFLWVLDVAWMWLSPQAYRERSPFISAILLGYFAFIAFNGAVIFEDGLTRIFGIPCTALLVWLALRRAEYATPTSPH
jgi:hypothetical protein